MKFLALSLALGAAVQAAPLGQPSLSSVNQVENTIQSLSGKLAQLSALTGDLSAAKMEKHLGGLRADVAEVEKTVSALTGDLSARGLGSNLSLQALQQELVGLTSKFSGLQASLKNIVPSSDPSSLNLGTLDGYLQDIRAGAAALKSLLARKSGADSLNSLFGSISTSNLVAQIDSLKAELDSFGAQLESVNSGDASIAGITTEITGLAAELEVLAGELDGSSNLRRALSNGLSLSEVKSELAPLKVEVKNVAQEVEKLKGQSDTSDASLSTVESHVKSVKAMLAKIESELKGIKGSKASPSKLSQLTSELNQLKSELATIVEEISTLSRSVSTRSIDDAQLEQEIASLEAKLSGLDSQVKAIASKMTKRGLKNIPGKVEHKLQGGAGELTDGEGELSNL